MRVRDQVLTGQGVLSAVAIAVMLGYAGHALQLAPQPLIAAHAEDRQAPMAQSPQEDAAKAAKSAVYSGTIVPQGSVFVLRDAAGTLYRLDDASKAQPFAGKPVKVTGKLDATVKLIHVEKIEEIRA